MYSTCVAEKVTCSQTGIEMSTAVVLIFDGAPIGFAD